MAYNIDGHIRVLIKLAKLRHQYSMGFLSSLIEAVLIPVNHRQAAVQGRL